MKESIAQCRYLLSLAEPIIAELDDTHRALQPQRGVKTAGWLVGHLAVTGDGGRRLCGRSPLCPKEWQAKFNPGSQPSSKPVDYPPMEQLREMFRTVYADLCVAATEADASRMDSVNPYEPARAAFPRTGAFVAWMLTGHLGYHVGQLVAWRAAAGLGRSPQPAPPT